MITWANRSKARLAMYDYIRSTRLFEAIQRLRKPEYMAAKDAEYKFYRELFDSRHLGTVFDIGANFGDKAAIFRRLADRVICVEPDRRAVKALKARFRRHPGVKVLETAIGAKRGTASLMRLSDGSALNTLSQKHADVHHIGNDNHDVVEVTTADSLIATYGMPSFIKVDVEGFESEVFQGLTQPVPLLCFEANLPDFKTETVTVIERLLEIDPGYTFNAISNDNCHTRVFDTWVAADRVTDFVKGAEAASYDIYATVDVAARARPRAGHRPRRVTTIRSMRPRSAASIRRDQRATGG